MGALARLKIAVRDGNRHLIVVFMAVLNLEFGKRL
jgi:hypothetical protein